MAKKRMTLAEVIKHLDRDDIFENPMPMDVKPDGFCFWGERRRGA